MAEPQLHSVSPRQQPPKKSVPAIVWVFGFIIVAGLGYVAGVANANGQLFSAGVNQLLGKKEINLASVQQTYQELVSNFDGEIDEAKLIEGANKGLTDALNDQYTVYMNAEESKEFDNSISGNIGGGIGIEIGIRNDTPTVLRVIKDNPAEKAGVMTGDIITQVNGGSVESKALNDIVSQIRGDAGTSVKLTVIREGESREFSITRETVSNPSAFGEVKDGIGILTVTRFDDQTGSLARAVAQNFKQQNVRGVVLDLRGNGGGYVTAAQALAGVWLDNKLVVTEKKGQRVVDELKSTGSPILNGIPTVVIVNKSSASASEIVAGALKDNNAATLLGETTFGKGSVQKLVNLMDGATLKVTIARWYTPGGINISEKGIAPDRAVERTADDINANRDPQLDAARGSF